MSRLVETIKIENGILQNISFHNERMIRSLFDIYNIKSVMLLEKLIIIPEDLKEGIFKCRVEYDRDIRKVEFLPYKIKIINSLKLVVDNSIDYAYKFLDRKRIEELSSSCEQNEDILIIKNRMITDSSYANVIFREQSGDWVTPSSYLLPGTQRASLLKRGIIHEDIITYKDLRKYSEVRLINAMMGIKDTEGIPISNLI
jgi:4-amino-4-deoxychorismate lyase